MFHSLDSRANRPEQSGCTNPLARQWTTIAFHQVFAFNRFSISFSICDWVIIFCTAITSPSIMTPGATGKLVAACESLRYFSLHFSTVSISTPILSPRPGSIEINVVQVFPGG